MKIGDVVKNRNGHRSLNSSYGVFLGLRTFVNQYERPWKVGGVTEEEFYICAEVAWYGGRTSLIQTNLIEVVDNVE